jgi:hypothetical protein
MKPVARRALLLVGVVLLVDAVFVGAYFLGHLRRVSDSAKVAFTVVWTVVTLGVVIRGLSRVGKAR